MNATRRKALKKALQMIKDAKSITVSLRDEEQDYYDNMPESFQDGEKGEKAQNAIDELDGAVSSLDDVVCNIENATE